MKNRAPEPSRHAGAGQVLPFRPRASALLRDAERDEAAEDAPDDFRHRMLVNAAGLTCAAVLTGMGIWLATSMSDLRRVQDCVLTGRRDCAPIAVVDQPARPPRQH